MTNKELLAKIEKLESRIEWLETTNKKNVEVISFLLEDYKSKAQKMTYVAVDGTKYEIDLVGARQQLKEIESANKTKKSKTNTVKAEKSEEVKTKKEWDSVGNVSYQGKYVKVSNIKNKTVRWAIQQTIKDFDGVKLTESNPVCKLCKSEDKFCQVYEFKTVKDCEKFIADQRKRVG